MSDGHEVSHQKTSEYVGLFFLGRLTNTLKFSVEFNKKKSKTKEACGRELIPAKHSADLQSVTFRTRVLHATESLFSKFSARQNLPGRAKCGRYVGEEEKEWVMHGCSMHGMPFHLHGGRKSIFFGN